MDEIEAKLRAIEQRAMAGTTIVLPHEISDGVLTPFEGMKTVQPPREPRACKERTPEELKELWEVARSPWLAGL